MSDSARIEVFICDKKNVALQLEGSIVFPGQCIAQVRVSLLEHIVLSFQWIQNTMYQLDCKHFNLAD